MWVWSLSWEDPLEKEMATCSSILAWRIPCIEEPGRLQSLGSQRVRPDWAQTKRILDLVEFPPMPTSPHNAQSLKFINANTSLPSARSVWKDVLRKRADHLTGDQFSHSQWRGGCWASQVALVGKNLPAHASAGDVRDLGLIPGLGVDPWTRKWQPTPVFLPGESQGQRSLVGYSP